MDIRTAGTGLHITEVMYSNIGLQMDFHQISNSETDSNISVLIEEEKEERGEGSDLESFLMVYKGACCILCGDVITNSDDSLLKVFCDDCFALQRKERVADWKVGTLKSLSPCKICHDMFVKRKSSVGHTCRRRGVFSCCYCGKQWKSNIRLMIHQQNKHYVCEICGKKFKTAYGLKGHFQVHTGERPFSCNVCGQTFTKLYNAKVHMRIHTGEKPHVCEICGRAFSISSILKTHLRTHTGEKPYVCKICGNTFAVLSNLKGHVQSHNRTTVPYFCDMCPKTFAVAKSLKVHKLREHDPSGVKKTFPCIICSRELSNKHSLMHHMNTQHGVKSHACDICSKTFAVLSQLEKHKLIHEEGRNVKDPDPDMKPKPKNQYICYLCDKSFTSRCSITRHIEGVHMGKRKKKLPCEVCGKLLHSSHYLKEHMYGHTGEFPHHCKICGRGFTQNSHVTVHMRMHLGDRPYKCEFCEKAFFTSSDLRRHLLSHSSERPFACKICGARFKEKRKCTNHEKRIHSYYGD